MTRLKISACLAASGLALGTLLGTVPAQATGTASMKFSPTSKTVKLGRTFTVTVTVNTATHPVNAVQIALTTSGATLECLGIAPGTAWPATAATSCGPGRPTRVAVYTPAGTAPYAGTAVAAVVSFKAPSSPGSTVVTVDNGYSYVVTSDTNQNILGTTNKATITTVAG